MITPEQALAQLRGRAERHWLAWTLGRGSWPYRIQLRPPSGAAAAANVIGVQNWAGTWQAAASQSELPGELGFVSRRVPSLGVYSLPNTLTITDPNEALASFPMLHTRFLATVDRLEEAITTDGVVWSDSTEIPLRTANIIADLNDDDWDAALTVVRHLATNPVADLMIRQLAIRGVHTKWIEQHANLILTMICPPDTPLVDGDSLAQLRHYIGLRSKESRINVALRCPRLRSGAGGLDRFAATVTTLNASTLRPRAVLIVENDELGHTLTSDIDDLAVIHGLGKAVTLLAGLDWLTTADTVLYWGDIDRAGLQCLAALRRTGISVTPILMDLETLQRHLEFTHLAATQDPSYDIPDGLTEAEADLYEHLNGYHRERGEDLQLEQEHIPLTEAGLSIADGLGISTRAQA
jgi:hypothetical protein